jgi:hypothetical protein
VHDTDDKMVTALDDEEARSRLDLTRWLLRAAGLSGAADALRDDRTVYSMDDGGMGSFTLVPSHTGSEAIAEATYEDHDGVEVRITLFADQDRQPVEVDFWKVDFAPLLGFPSQNQLKDAKALRKRRP